MSEQAKLIYLKERIEDARESKNIGFMLAIIGIVLAIIGFELRGVIEDVGWDFGWVLIGIIGIFLAGIGFFASIYYEDQYHKLLDSLKIMATTFLTCPKCGKEIPQGNYVFCPFCGASLKS